MEYTRIINSDYDDEGEMMLPFHLFVPLSIFCVHLRSVHIFAWPATVINIFIFTCANVYTHPQRGGKH